MSTPRMARRRLSSMTRCLRSSCRQAGNAPCSLLFALFVCLQALPALRCLQTPPILLCCRTGVAVPVDGCSRPVCLQNAERLDSEIVYDRDFDYDYFGFKVGRKLDVGSAGHACWLSASVPGVPAVGAASTCRLARTSSASFPIPSHRRSLALPWRRPWSGHTCCA